MYLIRLDDASEYWDREKWLKIHDILKKYNVKPIFAVIPHNEDEKLLKYSKDLSYNDTINDWIKEGWTPALHGYNHVLKEKCGGINPVNERSEFAGLGLSEQEKKISDGYAILKSIGIDAKIFVAPAHTFDENTLEALKSKTDIRIISDTIASDIYYKDGFYYIPQQSGQVRSVSFKLTTFCYHPNTTDSKGFEDLESFLKNHSSEFISFDDLKFEKRELNTYDRFLSNVYFLRRKIRKIF